MGSCEDDGRETTRGEILVAGAIGVLGGDGDAFSSGMVEMVAGRSPERSGECSDSDERERQARVEQALLPCSHAMTHVHFQAQRVVHAQHAVHIPWHIFCTQPSLHTACT